MTDEDVQKFLLPLADEIRSLKHQLWAEKSISDLLLMLAAKSDWPVIELLQGMETVLSDLETANPHQEEERKAKIHRLIEALSAARGGKIPNATLQ